MSSLKLYVMIALCALVVGGTSAEAAAQASTGKVLVSGKQTLRQGDIDTIIKFYEWAFETEFTESERERFQELSIQAFRQDPAGSRKAADTLIGALGKVQIKSEAEQAKVRTEFNTGFIKDLRASNDDASALLTEIYDRSRNGSTDSGSTAANDDPEPPADNGNDGRSAGRLADIAGTWAWSRSGSMTKTTRGVYLGGNASRFTYEISPNGNVVFTGIMTTMTGGCKLTAFNTRRGRASLNGSTLTIAFGPTSFSRDDTCSPAKNYKKTLPAKTETYSVSLQDSYGQTQLCLKGEDEMCYSPSK